MSRQRLLAHQRSAATGTSLSISLGFVLLLTTIFHYDMVCPVAYNNFSLRFVQLAISFLQYQATVKLDRRVGEYVSFCNDTIGTPFPTCRPCLKTLANHILLIQLLPSEIF